MGNMSDDPRERLRSLSERLARHDRAGRKLREERDAWIRLHVNRRRRDGKVSIAEAAGALELSRSQIERIRDGKSSGHDVSTASDAAP